MCVGTSSSGRAGQLFRLDRFDLFAPFASRLTPAWADFAAAAGLDVVGLPTSPSPSTTTAPGLVEEATAQPMPGSPVGEHAEPPTSGEPALVESTAGDDDIAPPVMGVPPSSGDEEELLADRAGAPLLGVDVVDGEAQTVHFTPILAFDTRDVGVQTANEVMFSSFVGDTSREALATAIRALSQDDRARLVGALRLAEEQPLVDVAPAGGAGGPSSSSGPPLDLLDLTPGLPTAPTGVVDPGPSPATARTFWEEQDATAVAEMAAAKPVPDDDIDAGPPTSLEVFLAEQDAAAKAKALPPATGASSSSTSGPGPKKPFKKAPPPALVLDEPPKAAPKAPPMPCPGKPIRFLEDSPAKPKPTVKRPPGRRSRRDSTIRARSSSRNRLALRRRPGTRRSPSMTLRLVGRPRRLHLRRQAFIRQEQMARSRAGLLLLHEGATYQEALESSIARELAEQRQAQDAEDLAKAKPKGPPPHLVGTEVGQPFAPSSVGSSWRRRSRRLTQRGRLFLSGFFVTALGAYFVDFTAAAPSACAGVPPPPPSPFPPVDRVGRAGYGTRNQIRRPPAPGLST